MYSWMRFTTFTMKSLLKGKDWLRLLCRQSYRIILTKS
ncbi:hypothetical protein CPter91_3134 [Collimonas pratensis]|uniref:Uncharacterized protein n=1 Tax=Collimonas pratensis TaxID=279113 RepID=A0A127Q5Y1_9BURK|nr:hypothetical protein CPter91_3134 [Collimonas pratensis]